MAWGRGAEAAHPVRNGKVAGPNPAGSTRRFLPWRALQGTRADRLSPYMEKAMGGTVKAPMAQW